MKKGKLFTVLAALVLAAVGAFVAVTSVLSAQQQSVTSTLNVTYVANNVSAYVEVKSRVGASGDFAGTGTYSHTFQPANSSTTETLTTAPATLGFTSASDETFDEYVIYQFKFQNNYTTGQGCSLYVTMTDSFANYGSETVNVIRAYQYRTDATIPQVNISVTNNVASIGGDSNWSTTVPGTSAPIEIAVGAQPTAMYIYMVVAIKDQTKPISGYSNNAISFALSSTNS